MQSLYHSTSEIARLARDTKNLPNGPHEVSLDRANDGWMCLASGIVSDRYVSDVRVVRKNLRGAARYTSAVKLLRELRAAQTSHHPHKHAN